MSNLVYELAVVQDRGSHWYVTNVTKNSLDNLANRDEKYLKLSYVTYKLISDALMAGKTVRITKHLRTDEVLPFEFEVLDSSETQDPLAAAKDSSIVKVRMLVTPEIGKTAGLVLYSFIILNNDLSSRGYFITDKNREEQYLAILETGDEELIAKLEQYLNYRDELESSAYLERKFSAFRKQLQNAKTVEDVTTIEQQFLTEFFAHF